jgi:hypothetical protein
MVNRTVSLRVQCTAAMYSEVAIARTATHARKAVVNSTCRHSEGENCACDIWPRRCRYMLCCQAALARGRAFGTAVYTRVL